MQALFLSLIVGALSWVSVGTFIWCALDLTPQAHSISNAIATPLALFAIVWSFHKINRYLDARIREVRYVKRFYDYDVDVIVKVIQRALSGAHYNSVQWAAKVVDLDNGYLNFALTTSEVWAPTQSTLPILLLLEVHLSYDEETNTTMTWFVFGGNAFKSMMEGRRFQDHTKQIVSRIDKELPDHLKATPTELEINDMESAS